VMASRYPAGYFDKAGNYHASVADVMTKILC
jgi:hypothetical protein